MAKRYGFDFDVSNLTTWVDEKAGELAVRQVSEARTLQLIEIVPDVKGTEKRPTMSTEVTWQDGTTCSMSASGDTVVDQYEISSVKIGYEQSYCVDDLAPYFTRQYLTAGAMAEDKQIPFEAELTNAILEIQALELDKAIWKGDTNLSGATNLKWFDGFATRFDASGDVIEANDLGLTSFTAANIFSAFERVYTKTAEDNSALIDNPNWTIFCNKALFVLLKSYYAAENLYHFDPQNRGTMTIPLFGYDVNIEYVPGLVSKNSIYAGDRNSMKFATDLISDVSTFEMWYSQDDDAVKVRSKFRAGTAVPFLDEFTKFTLDVS
jgi:hypothetical protein